MNNERGHEQGEDDYTPSVNINAHKDVRMDSQKRFVCINMSYFFVQVNGSIQIVNHKAIIFDHTLLIPCHTKKVCVRGDH